MLEFKVTEKDIERAVGLANLTDTKEISKHGPVNYRCPLAQALVRLGYTCDVRHIDAIDVDNVRYTGDVFTRQVIDTFDAGYYDQLEPTTVVLVRKETN